MIIKKTALSIAFISLMLQAGTSQATCNDEIGHAAAKVLVSRCLKVSPATHPPCNASYACVLIDEEIDRGCQILGHDPSTPAFCKPAAIPSKAFVGTIAAGGSTDDMGLVIRTSDYRRIDAYCDGQCGDWFHPTGKGEHQTLNNQLRNKKALIRIANERNGERIFGPDKSDILTFIKKVELFP